MQSKENMQENKREIFENGAFLTYRNILRGIIGVICVKSHTSFFTFNILCEISSFILTENIIFVAETREISFYRITKK